MNFLFKIRYNISLSFRNKLRQLTEKLYYKVFPDRVNEHSLAMAPIETIKVTQYDLRCLDLVAEEIIPDKELLSDPTFMEYLYRSLYSHYEREIIRLINLDYFPLSHNQMIVRGRIKLYYDDKDIGEEVNLYDR